MWDWGSTFPLLKKVGRKGKVVGVDISPQLISQALKRAEELQIPNISFAIGNAEQLDFPDNTFDSVVSNLVLKQVSDRVKAIQEMKRVLKPGGYLGFTLPGSEHYKEFKKITAIVLGEDLFRPRKNCIQSDPNVLQSLLEETQISNAEFYSKVITYFVNSVEEYEAILETRGPKRMILRSTQANKQSPTWENILNEFRKILREKGRLPLTIHARAVIWRKPETKEREQSLKTAK